MHRKSLTMALDEITHFFRDYREKGLFGQNLLQKARENARCVFKSYLAKFKRYEDVPKEVFHDCLKALLHSSDIEYNLTTQQEEKIHIQLQRSSKIVDEDIFVLSWNFWLRKDSTRKPALLVVDIQNDFITGSLAVNNGAEVIPVINDLLKLNDFEVVVYSQDWHPKDHCSFASNVKLYPLHTSSPTCAEVSKVFDVVVYEQNPTIKQVLWPTHCEQNTWGAELHKDLKSPGGEDVIIRKGSRSTVDSYSTFWDNADLCSTPLFAELLKRGVTEIFICGLALDYCVGYSAEDAAELGLKTFVVEDACRAISVEGAKTTLEMFNKKGITLLPSSSVSNHLPRKGITSKD